MTAQWEQVEVPEQTGKFFSWGGKPGQELIGTVDFYSKDAGDYFEKPCPQLTLTLDEDAVSISKDGDRTDVPAGETVTLNCGQLDLKKAILAASPSAGQKIKIVFDRAEKKGAGTVKFFKVYTAGGSAASEDDEPPAGFSAAKWAGMTPEQKAAAKSWGK